jgi:uncharacterized protein
MKTRRVRGDCDDPPSRRPIPSNSVADDSGLITALTDGRLLGHPGAIEIRETHASMVFLTPSDVYKLKKPVDLGFLNYSTRRRRARMCQLELTLNRRLAPDVYLGVERVTRDKNGLLRLNRSGRAVDYLVHMRRVPDEHALDVLLHAGAADSEDVQRVGERIGAFHRTAELVPATFGPKTFLHNARENLAGLRSLSGTVIPLSVFAEFEAFLRQAKSESRHILDARVASGRIRDGHGDLRAEHVYLENGITILDCVEFDDRYRKSDTALDIAFLAMDLTARGYPDLVSSLMEGYQSATGDDTGDVLSLYCWYRALVRAKVASILASEETASAETRSSAGLNARRHIYHALRFARGDEQALVILVGGLPGSGKTTLARALGAAIGARVASADETRKRLAGLGQGVHSTADIDSGLYSSEMNERVYKALIDAADEALTHDRSVVLDATFRRRPDRESVRSLASLRGARFLMVECYAPDEVVVARLQRRVSMPDPWSDATVETFKAHLGEYEPPAELGSSEHVRVDTTKPLLAQVDIVRGLL